MNEKVTEFSSIEINNFLEPCFHTLHNRDAVVSLFKKSINLAISSDIIKHQILHPSVVTGALIIKIQKVRHEGNNGGPRLINDKNIKK